MKNAAYYELCLCVYNLLRDCEGYVEHLERMLPQIICKVVHFESNKDFYSKANEKKKIFVYRILFGNVFLLLEAMLGG